MVEGEFRAITGTIRSQNIERFPEGGGFSALEVNLEMDANGLAEAEIPFASGSPLNWAVKRGTGADQPAANADLVITGRVGKILQIATTLVAATTISGDVALTTIASGKVCGSINVKLQNSNASNSGKTIAVLILLEPVGRSMTT